MAIPFLACMVAASAAFHLPPRVLPSVQAVEGGRPGLVHVNQDGSEDFGVMQVNSRWVPRLASVLHQPAALTQTELRDDPCFNIRVGAAILDLCLHQANGDLMRAVGLYHSHNTVLAGTYLQRVLHAATALFVRGRQG